MARRVLPAVVYTDPEVAQVGLTGPELAARGVRHRSFTVGLEHCDRARIEGEIRGFARVHLAGRGDRILGATVVCRQAGEVIAQLGLATQMGLGLSAAATTVYAYPTRNELVSGLADAYNFARVTPGVRRLAKLWFRWGLW